MWILLWKDEAGGLCVVGETALRVVGERIIAVSSLSLLKRRKERLFGNLKAALFFCRCCFCSGMVGSFNEVFVGVVGEKRVSMS